GAGCFGKARQQSLLLGQRHVLVFATAIRPRLERLYSAVVIGHVRAVHRAQRRAHCRRNSGLRHSALTQQHHLDALGCAAGIFHRSAVFSRRTSALLHLTICLPRIRWRKRITPRPRKTIRKAVYAAYLQSNSRFKPFWRWYNINRNMARAASGSELAISSSSSRSASIATCDGP